MRNVFVDSNSQYVFKIFLKLIAKIIVKIFTKIDTICKTETKERYFMYHNFFYGLLRYESWNKKCFMVCTLHLQYAIS